MSEDIYRELDFADQQESENQFNRAVFNEWYSNEVLIIDHSPECTMYKKNSMVPINECACDCYEREIAWQAWKARSS